MTDKFTPGPWFVNRNSVDCGAGKISIEVAGDYFICQVDESVSQEANAALIAAAPELLQALEAMLNADRAYEYGGYTESELAAINQARAAIAKARGL